MYSSTDYPAHVDDDGVIVSGATFTPAFEQRTLGRVSDDGRSIVRGRDIRGEVVGEFDSDGTVYVGSGRDRRQIGRTDPPSGVAAVCLLLVLAADEIAKRPRDPAATARTAVGVASAAAGIAVVEVFKHSRHKTQPATSATAKIASVSPGVLSDAPHPVPGLPADRQLHPDVPEYTAHGPEFVEVTPEQPHYDKPLHPDLVHLLDRLRDWGGNVDGEYGIEDTYRRGLLSRTQLTESLWRFMCIHVAVLGGLVAPSEVFAFVDGNNCPQPPLGWREGGWKLLGPPQSSSGPVAQR